MTHKIDIHDYDKRYRNAKNFVERAQISQKDRDLIIQFERSCRLEGLSLSRRIRIMGTLVMFARLLSADFDKATKGDLKELAHNIDANQAWSSATKHTHRAILKKFYKWIAFGDEYRTVREYPPIISWLRPRMNAKDQPRVKASDILTEREIDELIKAAEHPRDKAFISMLYELGARIGEIGSLRIRDVSKDQHSFIVDLSGKTGHRTPRIVMSDPYLSAWLNIHPLKTDPNAPLWVMLGDRNKHQKMAYGAFRALIRRLKRKARLEKRIYPHLFRHTRVTHLLRNKQINESQAKVYFGWIPGSKILSEYSHLISQDVNEVMLQIHGIKPSENKKQPKIKQCPRCKKINPSGHSFCKDCGSILDVGTAMQLDEKRKGFDDIATPLLMDQDVQEALLKAMLKKGLGKRLMEVWNS
jgi:integrase